jgi:hypothetical protein
VEGSGKGASLSVGALLVEPGGGLLFWGSRRILGGGLRGRKSLNMGVPDGEFSRGLVYQGLEKALETGTFLDRGPVENHGGFAHWEL